MSSVPPNMPPGGGYPPYDPKTSTAYTATAESRLARPARRLERPHATCGRPAIWAPMAPASPPWSGPIILICIWHHRPLGSHRDTSQASSFGHGTATGGLCCSSARAWLCPRGVVPSTCAARPLWRAAAALSASSSCSPFWALAAAGWNDSGARYAPIPRSGRRLLQFLRPAGARLRPADAP